MVYETVDFIEFAAEVREALSRVVSTDGFATSPRLVSFLTYVVEESIAGRGEQIRGKTIATDVYGRELDDGGTAQNLVRVEARRLRRVLEEYYTTEGAKDPFRIRMEVGSYRPMIERAVVDAAPKSMPAAQHAIDTASRFGRTSLVAGGMVVLAAAVGLTLVAFGQKQTSAEKAALERNAAELAALRERSMPSLQAFNLAEEARGLFFPVFDIRRQSIALDMFRYAIELDPDLPSGHAGAAQVLATLAVISPDPSQEGTYLSEARASADKALALDPTGAWPNAAMAWVKAIHKDQDAALRYAERALKLAPEDGHVLDLVGMTAILAGNGALAADVSDPDRTRVGVGRFGANNIWGVSQLMLGNYSQAIEAFQKGPEAGAPVSAPSFIFSAAAYRALGDFEMEEKALTELRRTWPEFPGEYLAGRIFDADPETRDLILSTLEQSYAEISGQ